MIPANHAPIDSELGINKLEKQLSIIKIMARYLWRTRFRISSRVSNSGYKRASTCGEGKG